MYSRFLNHIYSQDLNALKYRICMKNKIVWIHPQSSDTSFLLNTGEKLSVRKDQTSTIFSHPHQSIPVSCD